MSTYAHIKRCLELSDRDIASAIADRRLVRALLDQLARISKPGDGAPKLLLLFAKAAAGELDWIDGALRVELVRDADVTVVDVLTELGAGMSERVFPSFRMSVPLDEFSRAVERVPHMIAPLSIASVSAGRLVLTASGGGEEEAFEEVSVDPVAIADESMYAGEKRASSKGKVASGSSPSDRPKGGGRSAAPRVVPLVVPRPPALPGGETASPEAEGVASRRAIVARVPLARIQVPRSPGSASRPPPKAAPPALKRASKPPPKRASVKPPLTTKRASSRPPPVPKTGTGSKPPPRVPSVRPPRSVAPAGGKRLATSEPPDEEGIDTGWDDES